MLFRNLHGVEERGVEWRYKCETGHISITLQVRSLVDMAKGMIKDRKEVMECLGHSRVRRSGQLMKEMETEGQGDRPENVGDLVAK